MDREKYYIVGGYKVGDFIHRLTPIWERPNLVSPPSLLQYDYTLVDGIHIYSNPIGCCVCLIEYGLFSNEEMKEDYNSTDKNSVYFQKYKQLLSKINNYHNCELDDVDWVMTLCSSHLSIGDSHVSIESPLFEENQEFVSFIDACTIYQSVESIAAFFKNLSTKSKLTKFEQYQISYYMQEINILTSPNFFLTNSDEKALMCRFYDKWMIPNEISTVQAIANQAVNVFSFMSNYRRNNKTDYATILMSYLSLLLLYDGIGDLLTFILPISSEIIGIALKIMIGAITLAFAFKILTSAVKDYKDKRNFKRKKK